jgi:hypothetical protein
VDISAMLVGKSDQLDNVDLLAGPRDFTITAVSRGSDDQPLNITLAEYGRPWRPGVTMRRLLAYIWGPEADAYIGRRVRLYRDPDVSFGKDKTGGTRLSHASHIERRITVALPTSKGKFGAFSVEPLIESAPARTEATNPNSVLLNEIGALADQLPGGRKAVADDWAQSHDGQSLRDATDLGGLELLRDDLAVQAAS